MPESDLSGRSARDIRGAPPIVVPAFPISARYVIDPAHTPAFKILAGRMAEAARRRAGCTFLNASADVLDPNTFHLAEGWTSQESFAEHMASDALQSVLKPQIEKFWCPEELCPRTPKQMILQ